MHWSYLLSSDNAIAGMVCATRSTTGASLLNSLPTWLRPSSSKQLHPQMYKLPRAKPTCSGIESNKDYSLS
jgi:hypothetical protein